MTAHRVPPGGLAGRTRPDAGVAPSRSLPAGMALQVLQQLGAWAEVQADDGWHGWVDGRRLAAPPAPSAAPSVAAGSHLAPMSTAAPSPAPTSTAAPSPAPPLARRAHATAAPPAATPSPVGGNYGVLYERAMTGRAESASVVHRVQIGALVGAGLLVLAAPLPWLRDGTATINAFDVPVQFLWDMRTTAAGSIDIGVVLIGLAIAAFVLGARPPLARWRRGVGGAAVLVATVYTGQVQRVLGELPPQGRPTLIGSLGLGVLVALVGGALVLWGGPRRPPP